MISVEVYDEKDEVLAKLWMRFPPHKGELLWFAGKDTDRLRKAHGASAFKVTDVAHWISSAWSPNTHVGQPVHSVCVYVEPVKRVENP